MKKINVLLLSIFLTSCAVTTQIIPKTALTTSAIVKNSNTTKNQLYITANDWMIDQFVNADSVLQFSDKEAGKLIGKYFLYGNTYTIYGQTADNRIFAKINITVKDNAAKIEISPVADVKINSKTALSTIKTKIKILVESFKLRMNSEK